MAQKKLLHIVLGGKYELTSWSVSAQPMSKVNLKAKEDPPDGSAEADGHTCRSSGGEELSLLSFDMRRQVGHGRTLVVGVLGEEPRADVGDARGGMDEWALLADVQPRPNCKDLSGSTKARREANKADALDDERPHAEEPLDNKSA